MAVQCVDVEEGPESKAFETKRLDDVAVQADDADNFRSTVRVRIWLASGDLKIGGGDDAVNAISPQRASPGAE